MNEDNLEIPAFLKRNKDGSLALPAAWIKLPSLPHDEWAPWPVADAVPVTWFSAEGLEKALNDPERTLIERQPIYMELRAREDKVKAYKRLAEMKAKKEAEKNAK
jgi:hypothetical protein